jgi:hypothetical protein
MEKYAILLIGDWSHSLARSSMGGNDELLQILDTTRSYRFGGVADYG